MRLVMSWMMMSSITSNLLGDRLPLIRLGIANLVNDLDDLVNGDKYFNEITLYSADGLAVGSFNGTDVIFEYRGITHELGKNLFIEVKADEDLIDGNVVQYTGQVGVSGRVRVKKAVASEINANPSLLLGVCTHAITNGQNGMINFYGAVNGLNTTAFTPGQTHLLRK